MLIECVAVARAETGGDCPECGMAVGVGNQIYKWASEGSTTVVGNGPGVWVCQWCHDRLSLPPTMEDEATLDVEPFVCELCHSDANPVVVRCGKVRCFACDREMP